MLFYYFVLILELIFAFSIASYMVGLVYSSLKGAPYVPTAMKEVRFILKEAGLKKNQIFLELGSGDGRVTREAVTKYGVRGVGIEINPVLILISRLWTKIKKIKNVKFKKEDILRTDISRADVIYLFLFPELIAKFSGKIKNKSKKNLLLISHGFKVDGFEKYLFKTINHIPFPTYYYRLK